MTNNYMTISFVLIMQLFYSNAQSNYYVSEASGSDANPGTQNAPFKTINHSAALSEPGDTIYVLPGIYTFDDPNNPWDHILVSNSGNENGYISYVGISDKNGKKPKIISASNAGFTCKGKSYIIIDNFEITTVDDDINDVSTKINEEQWRERVGINILEDSHHIIVRNCYIHDMRGHGIQCYKSDVVLIENNILEHNAFHSNKGNSGVSMYQMKNLNVAGFPEYSDHRLIITNNIARYNVNLRGFTYYQEKLTDGNGIIIDDLRHTHGNSNSYNGRALVLGNVSYGNGGQGINIFSSDHVDVYHNTLFDNAQSTRIENPAYDVEMTDSQLQVYLADDVNVMNNILYNSGTGKTVNDHNNETINYSNNIHWNSLGYINAVLPVNDMMIDPQLKNVAPISPTERTLLGTMTNPFNENSSSALLREPTRTQNFKIQDMRLKNGSPAMDSAVDLGYLPKTGLLNDIGAFDHEGNSLSTLKGAIEQKSISIYFGKDKTTMFVNVQGISSLTIMDLKIYNIAGSIVFEKKSYPININENENEIIVPELEGGVYILQAIHKNEKWAIKFVVRN